MRVTIDIDGRSRKDRLKLIMAYYNLKYLGGRVYVRYSARKGFHLKAHGFRVPFEKTIPLRLYLGDDPIRASLESKPKKSKNVLWTVKGGDEAGEWHEDIWEILQEY